MNELSEFIRSHAELGQEELTAILAQFQHRLVAKNKHILRRGHAARHYLFIRRGLLRVYFEDARDVEITGWIAAEQDFLCDLSSLKTGAPSRFSIQTLEESEIYMIEHSQMERLYAQFPAWQQFGRQIWESAFMRMLDAIIAYQTTSAEERYRYFLHQTDLIQRVPLKYLASYLGITPTSLSRLRKNIS